MRSTALGKATQQGLLPLDKRQMAWKGGAVEWTLKDEFWEQRWQSTSLPEETVSVKERRSWECPGEQSSDLRLWKKRIADEEARGWSRAGGCVPGVSGGSRYCVLAGLLGPQKESRTDERNEKKEWVWDVLIWSCLPDTGLKDLHQSVGIWGLNPREGVQTPGVAEQEDEGWESGLLIGGLKERHLKRGVLGILR